MVNPMMPVPDPGSPVPAGSGPLPGSLDLIVVGLGPAGMALAHRAQTRGWRVLGVDPGRRWPHTYGIFRDEAPGWLDPLPVQTSNSSAVIGPHGTRSLGREYLILDNDALRSSLATFPVVVGHGENIRANSVTVGTRRYRAPLVVDARGFPCTGPRPVQQAYGIVVAAPLTDDAAVWMDLRQHGGCRRYPTFLYQLPVRDGMLYEETILVADRPVPWQDLERSLKRRLGVLAPAQQDILREERVLIPMGKPSTGHNGGTVAFGARAGLISPISGYSVATSLQLVEPTLDALAPVLVGGRARTLPWNRTTMKLDRMLKDLGQKVLLRLNIDEFPRFMDALFSQDPGVQRAFLESGTPLGTVRGMVAVFRESDQAMRLRILQGILRG